MIWQTYMNTRQKKRLFYSGESRGEKIILLFFDGLLYLFVKKLKKENKDANFFLMIM